jgi:hypothetical protein
MKARKRGRPPLGRKAMTAAERQAQRRQRLREAARKQREERQLGRRRAFQPAHGYGQSKALRRAQGHHFERAREEFGFEGGVFVDGAFLDTWAVVELAKLDPRERQQRLAKVRKDGKNCALWRRRGLHAGDAGEPR